MNLPDKNSFALMIPGVVPSTFNLGLTYGMLDLNHVKSTEWRLITLDKALFY
jgi:hypothetical protein